MTRWTSRAKSSPDVPSARHRKYAGSAARQSTPTCHDPASSAKKTTLEAIPDRSPAPRRLRARARRPGAKCGREHCGAASSGVEEPSALAGRIARHPARAGTRSLGGQAARDPRNARGVGRRAELSEAPLGSPRTIGHVTSEPGGVDSPLPRSRGPAGEDPSGFGVGVAVKEDLPSPTHTSTEFMASSRATRTWHQADAPRRRTAARGAASARRGSPQ